MVLDAVLRHWLTGVIANKEEQGELGKEGRHHADLFYADDVMVAFSDPRWIQGEFNTLVSLFERVGLQTNVGKTVGMVFHPCQVAGNLSEASHRRKVTGEGPTYMERLKGQVSCGLCGELLEAGSLKSHLMTQHGRVG